MDESTKSMLMIGGGIIGIILIVLIVVWIISLNKDHYVTYETLETKMVEASKKYYAVNPKLLPNDGKEAVLNYDSLVREEYIKPLNEMLQDGDKCTAHIIVNNNDSVYQYTPYLNCPGNYETTELYKIILKNNEIVHSGSGLYSDGKGGYFFRGEVTNNFIKIGELKDDSNKNDNIWVIMGIDSDRTIKIRKYRHLNNTYVWDNRYNIVKEDNYGYNSFELSRIKSSLKTIVDDDDSLDKSMLNKLVPKKLCVGIRKEADTSKNGSIECSVMSEDSYYFGIMAPYEFMRASLDNNCTSLTSLSCSNYNYLLTNGSEWSLIATDENNYKVYYFSGKKYDLSTASNERSIYPTAYLSNKVFYLSGTGTLSDPYSLK